MSGSDAAPGPSVLGLLRTAELDVALPLTVLREVVPCPPELAALPVRAPGLLGTMSLRGTVVPVLDIAELLGRTRPRTGSQVVVVLAQHGDVLGLLVDEVRGMLSVSPADSFPLTAASSSLLVSSTVHDQDGRVVSVLDAQALLALPGVPVVREPEVGEAVEALRPATVPLTLLRCGAFVLGLGVAQVHSSIHRPEVRPSVVDGPTCRGVTPYEGSDVAVADVLALLGLGSSSGAELECGVVLDLPDGRVVLGVDSMVGLFDVPLTDVVPMPAMAAGSSLVTSVVDVQGVGPCLLLDGPALLAAPEVVALSRVATTHENATATSGASDALAPGRGVAHLAYRAGTMLTTPLSAVTEVLAYPTDLVPSGGAFGVLGVLVHRGSALPVLSLAALLGQPVPRYGTASRLLLVRVEGEPVAFAVDALHAILPLGWTDPDPAPALAGGALRDCPLVQLEGLAGLVPVVDLVALVTPAAAGAVVVPSPRAAREPVRPG